MSNVSEHVDVMVSLLLSLTETASMLLSDCEQHCLCRHKSDAAVRLQLLVVRLTRRSHISHTVSFRCILATCVVVCSQGDLAHPAVKHKRWTQHRGCLTYVSCLSRMWASSESVTNCIAQSRVCSSVVVLRSVWLYSPSSHGWLKGLAEGDCNMTVGDHVPEQLSGYSPMFMHCASSTPNTPTKHEVLKHEVESI